MTLPARFQPFALALPALLAVAFAAAPSSATAQGCTGAPGASAIQQYCEAVPSADGGSTRPGGGSGSGSGSGGSGAGSGVSAATSESLSQAGADGAAVERLAGGTQSATKSKATPKPKRAGSTGAEGSTAPDGGAVLSERVDGPSDPDGSPLKAATNAVSNGPTAGTPLAWSLAGLSIIGVAAAVFLRRRGGSLTDPDDES